MILVPQSAEKILACGGGLRVQSSKFMPDSLKRMAAIAAQNNGRLEIVVDSVIMPDIMAQIAAHGAGHVVFDVTD